MMEPMSERLAQQIQRLVSEEIAISAYDPAWPLAFRREKEHLLTCLPPSLIRRIEHFGSTAVPGLAAKPVIDMLVEVTDLTLVRVQVVPILQAQGYEYVWRPTAGDAEPPFYAWFIKRDLQTGQRTHHIHMVEADFKQHWDRLLFRDFLIDHPATAQAYAALKRQLAAAAPHDRVAYAGGKTRFIERVTQEARRAYGKT